MKELVKIVEFQKDEVGRFYVGLFVVDENTPCLKVNEKYFVLDEDILGEILEVPTGELGIVKVTISSVLKMLIVKREDTLLGEGVYKKALKLEYQLLFEMVNKVLLPWDERRSIVSIADLVLIEALASFTSIILPGIMIEHMMKVEIFKDWKHGPPYGFLLTKVSEHFDVPLRKVIMGTRKKMFTMSTLEECECVLKGCVSINSTDFQLFEA